MSLTRRGKELEWLEQLKPGLRQLESDALNAESPTELLNDYLTPISSFFVRNNGVLPTISLGDADSWKLSVDGEVRNPCRWTVAELRAKFENVSVTAVLECAGNGRSAFSPPTQGLQWRHGAVGCARWIGVRLRDLLEFAGLKESAMYTGHFSPDVKTDGSGEPAISRGLPIKKALAPETLVAFAMNDEPLPILHGGPLRIVAPGYPGSAWQKWLTRIWVRDREHDGEKMTGIEYRLPAVPISPTQSFDDIEFRVITDMPINSIITTPKDNFVAKCGSQIEIGGFAWSGHVPVSSVTFSSDGFRTSQPLKLEPSGEPFAWRRFVGRVRPNQRGLLTLATRATDVEGRSQPLEPVSWNPGGYCNNMVTCISGLVT
jgi:sulfite oxidase